MGLFSTEVPARHRAVVYYRGAFRKVVDSGRHRKRPGDHFVMVDLREQTAKQRGAARLEEARAETAALRSLANGARLLDASPALERLRLVQSAAYGSKLVLTVGDAD